LELGISPPADALQLPADAPPAHLEMRHLSEIRHHMKKDDDEAHTAQTHLAIDLNLPLSN
jgi:hypothetical protein